MSTSSPAISKLPSKHWKIVSLSAVRPSFQKLIPAFLQNKIISEFMTCLRQTRNRLILICLYDENIHSISSLQNLLVRINSQLILRSSLLKIGCNRSVKGKSWRLLRGLTKHFAYCFPGLVLSIITLERFSDAFTNLCQSPISYVTLPM